MKRIFAGISTVVIACFLIVSCQKELSYEGPVISNVASAWEFKQDTVKFAGTFDSVSITKTAGAYIFAFASGPSISLSETLELSLLGNLVAGQIYKSSTGFADMIYYRNGLPIYTSVALDTAIDFSITITSISDSIIVGTFSGKVEDASFVTKEIKEGKFTARTKPVIVVPTISAGTLGTTLDSCTGATVSGTYKKSVALTSSNTVTVSVNVTTAGSYSITTDTVKGIYFNKAGSFTSTGTQSLTLQGAGTPTDSAAAARFTVKYGTSACKFTVRIDTGAAIVTVPATGDYFPTTTNSNWSYNVVDSASGSIDTVYQRITGTNKTILGNPFNIILESPSGDSSYVRKLPGLYYSTIDLESLTGFGTLGETIALKDNVPSGTTWTDNVSTLKVDYVILAKAVPVTIGQYNFPDVIKVRSVVNLGTAPLAVLEFWYARGVGIIYGKSSSVFGLSSSETTTITRFTIF